MTTLQEQINQCVRDGLTPDQIAEALCLSVDAVRLSIELDEGRGKVDLVKMEKRLKIKAIKVLSEIMEDEDQVAAARVMAAKILLTGSGELTEGVGVDKLQEYFRNMKRVVENHDKNNNDNDSINSKMEMALIEV